MGERLIIDVLAGLATSFVAAATTRVVRVAGRLERLLEGVEQARIDLTEIRRVTDRIAVSSARLNDASMHLDAAASMARFSDEWPPSPPPPRRGGRA